MKHYLITILVAFLAVSGCNKPDSSGDDPAPDPVPTPNPPVTEPYFRATINDIYLQGPDDTGCSFMVETNMSENEWTVVTDADWIEVTKKSDEVILVPKTIERDQTFPAPREVTVTVKAGTIFSKSFEVIQEAWTRINSEYEVKLSPSGESTEVFVSHNCYSWTASCDASWLTVKKKDTSTLIITSSAKDAADTKTRSALVRLQSDRDAQTFWNITVSDAESNLGSEDYNYGDHTDWD